MTEKYTPEKVAELVERTKRMREWQQMEADDFLASDLEAVLTAAEDLTAVSAERDEAWRVASEQTRMERDRAEASEAERDRLHKAITEALEIRRTSNLSSAEMVYAIFRALTVALDKEGNDDE